MQTASLVSLQAYAPLAESGFSSITCDTVGHVFGYLENRQPDNEDDFVSNWSAPSDSLSADDIKAYYQHMLAYEKQSMKGDYLFYNDCAARYLGVYPNCSADNRLRIRVGTTSFKSYLASNFFKKLDEEYWSNKKEPFDFLSLETSRTANLLGIHCLIHNRDAMFPGAQGTLAVILWPDIVECKWRGFEQRRKW